MTPTRNEQLIKEAERYFTVKETKNFLRQHLIQFESYKQYQRQVNDQLGIGPIADSYIDNEIGMEEGMKAYHDILIEVAKKNSRILRAIKSVKGKAFHDHIKGIAKECEADDWSEWELITEPTGKFQEERWGREIRGIWVQQQAVGDSGDSWSGTICVKIRENKYLRFNFSM